MPGRRKLLNLVLAIGGLLCVGWSAYAAPWNGQASPHDAAHLVIVRTSDFRDAKGKPVPLAAEPGSEADKALALRVPEKTSAKFTVKHAGKYTLWVRVAAPENTKGPLTFSVRGTENVLAEGPLNQGAGAEGQGGAAGFQAYAVVAKKTGAEGKLDKNTVAVDPDSVGTRGKAAAAAAEFEDELLADLGKKPKLTGKQLWIQATRLEEPQGQRAFYWWRAASVDLEPGSYFLDLIPTHKKPEHIAAVDLAFLTTSTEVVYPYAGDVSPPKASYIRFRIDSLPAEGATINAMLRIHSEPWSTGAVWLNPERMSITKSEPHKQTGFTRWYRLQDIEDAPGFGAAEAQLHLTIASAGKSAAASGRTQFAVFPHQDWVLREIDWSEPDGTNLSMLTDFESYLHRLRTLRDHAREHYEFALQATNNRIFPLTRGDLYFGNAWGASRDAQADYMVKTFRLLGFNSVGQAFEPIPYRKLYGWTSHAGQYWPPVHMPFDEEASIREYDKYYSKFFDAERELYKDVSIFQIADEPGEISRQEMSSPLWRYQEAAEGDKWADLSGNSELTTKKCDFSNCVLEGKVEKHGGHFVFRVAVDKPENPTQYADWAIGQVSQNREINVSASRKGYKPESVAAVTRRGAVVNATPTAFKIVHDGNSAALFLEGKLIHQHSDLPAKGGFGFAGPAKALCELRLRPMRKNERLAAAPTDTVAAKSDTKKADDLDTDDLLEEVDSTLPDWARPKPLKDFVREDWVIGGGMPEAHVAFRKWAAEQGLQPDLFGAKDWEDVRMLTVPELIQSPEDRRLFYWSRKFSGYLTPRMFAMSADAIQKHAPNPKMKGFVALSGHSLYFPSTLPLDMFQLAEGAASMIPGISDWMSLGSWRWDTHQAVAYSVAMYNSGARRFGKEPASFPMMHCVWPSEFRAYTMLANQVKYVSFYNFGPSYAVTEGYWSDAPDCYQAVHKAANRAAQVDDILATGQARPSRVALLYSMSNEYWNPQSSFADKRATFLALSHEYFQPELVTEDQLNVGALAHYDALYVLEPIVSTAAQEQIAKWVQGGGLLWTCADALRRNEFNEPQDLLAELGVKRSFNDAVEAKTPAAGTNKKTAPPPRISPTKAGPAFQPHSVAIAGMPQDVAAPQARVQGVYDSGNPAWIEQPAGKGRLVYLGHRPGLTYTAQGLHKGGYYDLFADTGRAPLVQPLLQAKVARELTLSEPLVMAAPLSTDAGTVVILYNMQPQPLQNLRLMLKESQAPHSVEIFVDDKLQAIPHKFAAGQIELTLPKLEGGQMVVVRRAAPPADERDANQHEQTLAQLKSADWRALSSGAWFAGFHPEWKLTDSIIPLLKHSHWEVRRSAAESLGRLHAQGAGDTLVAALKDEADSHVTMELLEALSWLEHPRIPTLAAELTTHGDPQVRCQCVRVLDQWVQRQKQQQAAERELVQTVIDLGLGDPDLRVRSAAMNLQSRVAPQQTLALALAAYESDAPTDVISRPDWAATIARHDAVFEAYVADKLPGGPQLLFGVASQRAAPALAAALIRAIPQVEAAQTGPFLSAVLKQHDPALSRAVFAAREKLPPNLAGYATLVLEHTFGARLGDVAADWEAWLKKIPAK